MTESTDHFIYFRGQPGDEVRLFGSPEAGFEYRALQRGVDLLGELFQRTLGGRQDRFELGQLLFPSAVAGTVPASGILRVTMRALPMTPAEQARAHHLQALFTAPGGQATWSNGCVVVSLDETAFAVD